MVILFIVVCFVVCLLFFVHSCLFCCLFAFFLLMGWGCGGWGQLILHFYQSIKMLHIFLLKTKFQIFHLKPPITTIT